MAIGYFDNLEIAMTINCNVPNSWLANTGALTKILMYRIVAANLGSEPDLTREGEISVSRRERASRWINQAALSRLQACLLSDMIFGAVRGQA